MFKTNIEVQVTKYFDLSYFHNPTGKLQGIKSINTIRIEQELLQLYL